MCENDPDLDGFGAAGQTCRPSAASPGGSTKCLTAFGFFAGAALFGGSISPSVAGLLAHWDLRTIYYVDGLLYVGLALALLAGRWRPR